MKKKLVISACAVILAVGTVLGSLAYFTDQKEVQNTFTVGKVAISLTETDADEGKKAYHLIPGMTLDKDPTVSVEDDSEDCYLFFTEEKGEQSDAALTYTLNTAGWQNFGNEGKTIYYREVAADDAERTFNLIADNEVQVKTELTNDTITDASEVFLTYKAYAVQKSGFLSAQAAFAECFA